MKLLATALGLTCYITLPICAQRSTAPGAMITSAGLSLDQFISEQRISAPLPRNAERSRMLSCFYLGTSGSREVRYFWYYTTPAWLPSLPENHPLRTRIGRMIRECPATLSIADRPPGPLDSPLDAQTVMGSMGGGAVFAVPLNSKPALMGKWTRVTRFTREDRRFGRQYEPSAPAVRRILTDTDLIEMEGASLTVIPLTYRDRYFCPNDPMEDTVRCYQLAQYNGGLAIIELKPKNDFELIALLEIPEDQTAIIPPEAVLARVRAERAAEGQKRAERRADDGFVTRGLESAQLLLNLHDGKFDEIDVRPNQPLFAKIVNEYMENFAASTCQLPVETRIELTRTVCDGQIVNTKTGQVINSCTPSHQEGRGVYADPGVYNLEHKLGFETLWANWQSQMRSPSGGRGPGAIWNDVMQRVQTMATVLASATRDMKGLFGMNACSSPGLKRFQENMLRFGNGQQPILSSGLVAQTPEEKALSMWEQNCRRNLAEFIPGARPDACACLHATMQRELTAKLFSDLGANFTRENFLLSSVAKVNLADKVGACLQ